jgi:endogenous inhibitor of DNA gyrase (YacG/DUF329 family)
MLMPPDAVCAYCHRQPVDPRWRPFCSEHCKLVDLGRWLKGDYRIPGPSIEPATPSNDDDDQENV